MKNCEKNVCQNKFRNVSIFVKNLFGTIWKMFIKINFEMIIVKKIFWDGSINVITEKTKICSILKFAEISVDFLTKIIELFIKWVSKS